MTEKTFDILCVGIIVADQLVKPVDRGIFDVDATRVDEIKVMPGGDAMNEAIILSRLGRRVGLVGKVGEDQFGKMVLREAEENGVDVSNVKVDGSVVTSTSIVLINENGDRNFVYCAGNNDKLSLADIDQSIFKRTKIVSIGSVLGLAALDGAGAKALFKEAQACGAITSADTNHDSRRLGFEGVRGVLEYTDIFIPSYDEARYLTNETEPERMCDIFLGCGVKTVVIKNGARGCFIKNYEGSFALPAYKARAIDTTGAGDNFVAGFLTGISMGWDLKKCGMLANATGALSTEEIGATSAVRGIDQVKAFMDKNKI